MQDARRHLSPKRTPRTHPFFGTAVPSTSYPLVAEQPEGPVVWAAASIQSTRSQHPAMIRLKASYPDYPGFVIQGRLIGQG